MKKPISRTPSPAPALFLHAVAALEQVLGLESPADRALSRYFREHHEAGHADRGWIAEHVHAVLRHLATLSARCPENATPRQLLLALLLREGRNLRELAHLVQGEEERAWLARVKGFSEAQLSTATRLDLPEWFYTRLLAHFGAEETQALACALNQPAPLDLRVNPLKIKRPALIERLNAEGIAATAGRFSPLAVRLREKPALAHHPLFLDGSFEIQDEGSQLLGFLLAPRRGEMVADFCAGAGGKTLLLGALMHNTGRIYAFDVSEKRLRNLKPRLARSGLSNVHPERIDSERDIRIRRLAGKLDRVLVDAPCSGLGTLRRNPDLKWRRQPEDIAELTQKQTAILNAAASLLRPGGTLVYATCSLLPEENEAITAHFCATHPEFTLQPIGPTLQQTCPDLPIAEATLQLLPHHHDTDAFYAARFERKGS
ncbi:MAG: RsmB/NOP family class I SAM-dependent RNA methyltransferase [Zoogloeaceae bacterium]|nr:RsmB/NOP family class I SAM-dependent RNA methyltransferase [Zoogloeaceae bacterium]